MAFFGITIERIGKIWPHPKADKMELASCDGLGFQFCVGKNQFSIGEGLSTTNHESPTQHL